jgi:hypothetical protein
MIQDSAKTTCDSMAASNDTKEERRVGGGRGLFCFSCAAAIMDLSYPFPLVSKEPFFWREIQKMIEYFTKSMIYLYPHE